jgi:hypothetical protein
MRRSKILGKQAVLSLGIRPKLFRKVIIGIELAQVSQQDQKHLWPI